MDAETLTQLGIGGGVIVGVVYVLRTVFDFILKVGEYREKRKTGDQVHCDVTHVVDKVGELIDKHDLRLEAALDLNEKLSAIAAQVSVLGAEMVGLRKLLDERNSRINERLSGLEKGRDT